MLKVLAKLTIILVGIFATVILAATVLLWYLQHDLPRLRPVLEEGLSYVLKRELEIGELLEADIGVDTLVRARNVRLANPPLVNPYWTEEAFVTAQYLEVRISIPSIFDEGPLILQRVKLENASVHLLDPADHPPSWEFYPGRERPEEEPGLAFPIVIEEGRVTHGEVIYRDPDQELIVNFNGKITNNHQDHRFEISLDGMLNELPLALQAHVGPQLAWLTGRDLELDIAAQWGQLELTGKGTIGDLANLLGTDMMVRVEAPHSRPLLDALGMTQVRDGPLRFSGRLSDGAPGLIIDATGSLESFDLAVQGRLSKPMEFDGVELKFSANGPSLAEFGATMEILGMPGVPYSLSGEIARKGSLLVLKGGELKAGDSHITAKGTLPAFPQVDDWDVAVDARNFNLALVAPFLGLEELPSIPYNARGLLHSDEEGVELLQVQITGPSSKMRLSGRLGEAPQYAGTRIELKFVGESLKAVGDSLGIARLPGQAFEIKGQIIHSAGQWGVKQGLFILPELQVHAEGEIDRIPDPTHINARVGVSSPDLAQTLSAFGIEAQDLSGFPLVANATLQGNSDRLEIIEGKANSGDNRIRAEGLLGNPATLEGLDLKLSAAGPDLLQLPWINREGELAPAPFDVAGRVQFGEPGITLENVSGMLAGANIDISGLVTLKESQRGTRLAISGSGPALGRTFSPWVDLPLPDFPFSLDTELELQPPLVEVHKLLVQVGKGSLKGHLNIEGEGDQAKGRGQLTLSGASSHQLALALGITPILPDDDFSFTSDLKAEPGYILMDSLQARMGRSDVSGQLEIKMKAVPLVKGRLHSKLLYLPFLKPDLKELEAEQNAAQAKGNTFSAQDMLAPATAEQKAQRVIPDTPLPFEWLDDIEADLYYKVDEIFVAEDFDGNLVLDFSLLNGKLQTRQFEWGGDFSSGEAEIMLENRTGGTGVRVYLDSERIPFIWLVAENIDLKPSSVYRVDVEGEGDSVRELLRSLDGLVAFSGGGSRISNNALDLVLGDIIGEIFVVLNPAAEKEKYTELVCHAGALKIDSGKVTAAPGVVVRTDKVDIFSRGKIDLHDESLNLVFNTQSRKGVGLSLSKAITPFMKLEGNLAHPQLGVNVKSAAVTGWAAVATGGLSLVAEGVWDRWIAGSANPCEKLFEKVNEDPGGELRALLGRP